MEVALFKLFYLPYYLADNAGFTAYYAQFKTDKNPQISKFGENLFNLATRICENHNPKFKFSV